MICYYSDQRDNATYGQTMVHQVSTDLKNWGPVVEDVTYPTYTDRPGMPVVTKVSYTEDTDSIANYSVPCPWTMLTFLAPERSILLHL